MSFLSGITSWLPWNTITATTTTNIDSSLLLLNNHHSSSTSSIRKNSSNSDEIAHSESSSRRNTFFVPPDQIALNPTSTTKSSKSFPHSVVIRQSLCGTFEIITEFFSVPFTSGEKGALPLERRCIPAVYAGVKPKGVLLLVHGFASNSAIFDQGGFNGPHQSLGRGKVGPSFIEFFAKRGYDVFAMDLRGSKKSIKLGASPPSSIKEHIEIDVPSVLAFIKTLVSPDKVFLIGHSMGGAISCSVAGLYPDDVAGIVHLAGLYSQSTPVVAQAAQMWDTKIPSIVKNLVSTTALAMTNLASSVLSPFGKAIRSSKSVKHLVKYIRQQPIPLRLGIRLGYYLHLVVPSWIERSILESIPVWVPGSVDDTWGFILSTIESPSIGVYYSILSMQIHQGFADGWKVLNSSPIQVLEAEDIEQEQWNHPSATEKPAADEVDRAQKLDHLLFSSSEDRWKGTRNGSLLTQGSQSRFDWLDLSSSPASLVASPTSSAPLTATLHTPNTIANTNYEYHDDPPLSAASVSSKPAIKPFLTHPAVQKEDFDEKQDHWSSWNELAPYLRSFERLHHVPLFVAYANADQILRPDDTKEIAKKSVSKWMDVIQYVEVTSCTQPQSPHVQEVTLPMSKSGVNISSKALTTAISYRHSCINNTYNSGNDVHVNSIQTINAQDSTPLSLHSPTKQCNSLASQGTETLTTSFESATTGEFSLPRRMRVKSSMSLNRKCHTELPFKGFPGTSSGLATTAGAPAEARSNNITPSVTRSRRRLNKDEINPVYTIPSEVKYGHSDILSGRNAEIMWERIADWLDATSSRERQWKYKRRYSIG